MNENEQILRSFAEQGLDLSTERPVDFNLLVPDGDAARQCRERVEALGYTVAVHEPDEEDLEEGFTEWDVVCTKAMIPTEANITAAETSLGEIAHELGGQPDGWGFYE